MVRNIAALLPKLTPQERNDLLFALNVSTAKNTGTFV